MRDKHPWGSGGRTGPHADSDGPAGATDTIRNQALRDNAGRRGEEAELQERHQRLLASCTEREALSYVAGCLKASPLQQALCRYLESSAAGAQEPPTGESGNEHG